MNKHISKHPETQHLPDDVVHYREYKILLKPDRFTSRDGFLEFWKAVHRTLKQFDLKVDLDDDAFHSQVREVLFYDTPRFDLYNHHFILRNARSTTTAGRALLTNWRSNIAVLTSGGRRGRTSVRSSPAMTRLSSKKSYYSGVISWAECGACTRMAAC